MKALRLPLMAVLAGATALLCILCLVALNGGGAVKLGPVTLMELAAGYARPAEKLMAAPAPAPADAARAEVLSRKALEQFPYDNSSWLRLAYADTVRNGRLTPEGVKLLETSYALTDADIYAGIWRIGFILEHSGEVPRELRLQARHEFELLAKDWKHREDLREMAGAIRNPAGRLSAALWMNQADQAAAAEAAARAKAAARR